MPHPRPLRAAVFRDSRCAQRLRPTGLVLGSKRYEFRRTCGGIRSQCIRLCCRLPFRIAQRCTGGVLGGWRWRKWVWVWVHYRPMSTESPRYEYRLGFRYVSKASCVQQGRRDKATSSHRIRRLRQSRPVSQNFIHQPLQTAIDSDSRAVWLMLYSALRLEARLRKSWN